jgi:hypothetical protein
LAGAQSRALSSMSSLTDETEKDFALRTVEEKIIESLDRHKWR